MLQIVSENDKSNTLRNLNVTLATRGRRSDVISAILTAVVKSIQQGKDMTIPGPDFWENVVLYNFINLPHVCEVGPGSKCVANTIYYWCFFYSHA